MNFFTNHDASCGKNHTTSHDVRWEMNDDVNPDTARERNDPTNHDTDRDEDDTTNQNATQGMNDKQTTNEPILQQNSESISTREARRMISIHIDSIWQQQWNDSTKGNDYKKMEPLVSRKLKFTRMNRGRETIATRLRFGKCALNFYLKIIGKHATGNCSKCNVPETIEHFILQCPNNLELVTELTKKCVEDNLGVEISNVLKNDETMEMIIDYIIRIKRKI